MIIRVDPATGQQSIVAEGGCLWGPFGMTTTPDGTIYVADDVQPGAAFGLVFRVNPSTGQQTIISGAASSSPPRASSSRPTAA